MRTCSVDDMPAIVELLVGDEAEPERIESRPRQDLARTQSPNLNGKPGLTVV